MDNKINFTEVLNNLNKYYKDKNAIVQIDKNLLGVSFYLKYYNGSTYQVFCLPFLEFEFHLLDEFKVYILCQKEFDEFIKNTQYENPFCKIENTDVNRRIVD